MHLPADASSDPVRRLAECYGVELSYRDGLGQYRDVSPDSLLAVLRALGAPLENLQQAPAALEDFRQRFWQQLVEPVVVTWLGQPTEIEIRIPHQEANSRLAGTVELESGRVRKFTVKVADLESLHREETGATAYLAKKLRIAQRLPSGYHRVWLEVSDKQAESLLIVAPRKSYFNSSSRSSRSWGVFLPLYSLRTQTSWGAGDLGDLEAFCHWVGRMGGRAVGTLPLLAAFLAEPFEPSPYSPASRLFWNEFYADPKAIPELKRCRPAQSLLNSANFRQEVEQLRASPLVDYRRQMALKRQFLGELARCFFSRPSRRRIEFERFLQAHPNAEDYARFRATGERLQAPWSQWPARPRSGRLQAGDYDKDSKNYHLYVQWIMEEQLAALSDRARQRRLALHLDLPLGVNPDSYDVWRERSTFVLDIAGGAPPDALFTGGQNWGFPPLHPAALRTSGYRYYIACLRHLLRHSRLLRIDHVMGLHRQFWIPRGQDSRHGAYVRYPAEEFYAILSLESHRHKARLIGENLGTVPSYVNPALQEHGISGMFVGQAELRANPQEPLRPVSSDSLACVNTHDMFPFAGYWEGLDIDDRLSLGLQTAEGAAQERYWRGQIRSAWLSFLQMRTGENHVREALEALLRHLAASPAWIFLVNLEDLWQEKQPQNVPSTKDERPNWRRPARYSLEEFCQLPQIVGTLRQIARWRRAGSKGKGK